MLKFLNPFSGAWKYIAAFGAGVGVILTAYLKGVSAAKNKMTLDNLKDSAKKQKDGQDAVGKEKVDTDGLSSGDVIDRMRRRGWH